MAHGHDGRGLSWLPWIAFPSCAVATGRGLGFLLPHLFRRGLVPSLSRGCEHSDLWTHPGPGWRRLAAISSSLVWVFRGSPLLRTHSRDCKAPTGCWWCICEDWDLCLWRAGQRMSRRCRISRQGALKGCNLRLQSLNRCCHLCHLICHCLNRGSCWVGLARLRSSWHNCMLMWNWDELFSSPLGACIGSYSDL